MTRKIATIAASGMLLLVGAFGCQVQPNQAICNDAPKFEEAIANVPAQSEAYKAELLEDAQEYAADPGYCPDYAGMAEEPE